MAAAMLIVAIGISSLMFFRATLYDKPGDAAILLIVALAAIILWFVFQ